MRQTIINPILKGFNPDPSMINVDGIYYIATSTFEWFGGVQIHSSNDLINWKLETRALQTTALLDLKGCPDSCGVWAPNLTYHDGLFYLLYSNVKMFDGRWKDLKNYLTTATSIFGPWSDPVFINSSGFDASLFHDDDGRAYVVNMLVDHRNSKFFGGIILQEYSYTEKKLLGDVHHIFQGSEIGITEGPNIYKHDGYYYLITAEGGTEYGHAVSMARSRHLLGPYELHPHNPILTSANNPSAKLQKAGHASIVEANDGSWIMSCLVARPLSERGRCTLGRETALQPVEWREDGWLYLKSDSNMPCDSFQIETNAQLLNDTDEVVYTFKDSLPLAFQTLRVPANDSWISFQKKDGWLALKGRESLCSISEQSLVARRVDAFDIEVEVELCFNPDNFQQMAGLVCYYNTQHWHYLYLSFNEENGQVAINVMTNDYNHYSDAFINPLPLQCKELNLKAIINKDKLHFEYKTSDGKWTVVGGILDFSILSDDYVCQKAEYKAAFTGAFIGVCSQDLSGLGKWAYFRNFKYKKIN